MMAGDGKARPPRSRSLLAIEPWRAEAACYENKWLSPSAWDDSALGEGREDDEARKRRIAAAIHVCETQCPVRAECLRDVDLELDSGVRGGVDLRRLAESHRSRKPLAPDDPRHGTTTAYDYHRCRCEKCRAANAAAVAEWKRKKRGEKAS